MSDWSRDPAAPRRPRWRALLLLCLLMVAIGAALTLWVIDRFHLRGPATVDRIVRVPVAAAPALPPAASLAPAPESAPTQPDTRALTSRLSTIEARLDDVDQRSRAAVGDAGRAEGLLVAVAARRALDAGMPLGYLEGLLRERFGASHAAAVATILSAARQPVTLDELRAGLDAIAPKLARSTSGTDWWSRMRGAFSDLVVVRRAGVPSAAPADRVAHAQRMLDDGHVDRALAEVARLPASADAADWMGQARRYLGARAALEQVETAALLEPAAPITPVLPPAQPLPAAGASPAPTPVPASPAPPPPAR